MTLCRVEETSKQKPFHFITGLREPITSTETRF